MADLVLDACLAVLIVLSWKLAMLSGSVSRFASTVTLRDPVHGWVGGGEPGGAGGFVEVYGGLALEGYGYVV